MKNPQRQKLSKRLLMEITTGYWVVSNCFSEFNHFVFYEAVEPIAGRDEQWNRIKAARADQRLCNIFETKEECDEWMSELTESYMRKMLGKE